MNNSAGAALVAVYAFPELFIASVFRDKMADIEIFGK